MGISAFIMADFLGVSYFEVIARGFAPAIVYYAGIAAAVYLLSKRYISGRAAKLEGLLEAPTRWDKARVIAFFAGIGLLVAIMGALKLAPMYAALLAAAYMLAASATIEFLETRSPASVASRVAKSVENFASFVADLTLLLATLGIMTGLLTVTGLPTKIGFAMMNVGAGNLALLALIAFAFGYLVGLGLPPAATFIITAIVIVPHLISAGVDPWVAYFYAFFLGVFSELSPPTSVTAAVASKIAGASFMKTMGYALIICIPLFILMPGVFAYPQLVVEPGAAQAAAALALVAASVALAVAAWGPKQGPLAAARPALALLALALLAAPWLGVGLGEAALLAIATLAVAAYAGARA